MQPRLHVSLHRRSNRLRTSVIYSFVLSMKIVFLNEVAIHLPDISEGNSQSAVIPPYCVHVVVCAARCRSRTTTNASVATTAPAPTASPTAPIDSQFMSAALLIVARQTWMAGCLRSCWTARRRKIARRTSGSVSSTTPESRGRLRRHGAAS